MDETKTRLGMIVRCDQGGLGNQTRDLHKHLTPSTTLLINLPSEKGRGIGYPADFAGPDTMHWHDDVIPPDIARQFEDRCDVILSVEVFYSAVFSKARTVLVANPELWQGYDATTLVVPTTWMLERMPPEAVVLPHPVTHPPVSQVRRRHSVTTFLHVAAPAMLDRNGTTTVMEALQHVDEQCQLWVHAPGTPSPTGDTRFTVSKVDVRWSSRYNRNAWSTYDVEADVMLLPRRYGGLCLPVQEAAACGLPSVMTALSPQNTWPVWTIPTKSHYTYPMRGGEFPVYDTDPRELAKAMTDMVRGGVDIEALSDAALAWAEQLSWDNLLPRWQELVVGSGS